VKLSIINESCLSPERSEVEFFHFSKANLEFAKSGKQSEKWVLKQLRVTFSNAAAKQFKHLFVNSADLFYQHIISAHFVKLFQKKIGTVYSCRFTAYSFFELINLQKMSP